MVFRLINKNFNVGVYLHLQDRIKEEEKALENLIVSDTSILSNCLVLLRPVLEIPTKSLHISVSLYHWNLALFK